MTNLTDSIDFFVPNLNEIELIDATKKTGDRKIVMLYTLPAFQKKFDSFKTQKVYRDDQDNNTQQKIFYGILLTGNYNDKMFSSAQKITDYLVIEANENVRNYIERYSDFFVFGTEKIAEKDFVHQRDSGVNQVLATLATKKSITFLFNIKDFIQIPLKNKAIIIGRLSQNIRIFSQYKSNYLAASFAQNKKEIKSNLSSFINVVKMNYKFE